MQGCSVRVAWLEDPDLNYAMLAFEDEASGDFFAIQRSLTFTEQDRSLGMDTYCLVCGEATHYGGLDSFDVDEGQLRMRLSPAAAYALEIPLVIEISVNPPQAATIRRRLPGLIT